MSHPDRQRRREFVTGAATAAVALAGCLDFLEDSIEFDEEVPEAVTDHLAGANNVDGSIEDRTGEEMVTIENGPGGNFAYDPALIRVDTGTEITWMWESSNHSVTSASTPGESFDSGTENSGTEFTQRFEESGNVLYYCRPHRGAGHVGAIIVE